MLSYSAATVHREQILLGLSRRESHSKIAV